MDSCGEQHIAFVPFFTVAGTQREAGASNTHDREVLAIAHAHRVAPAQIRLAWTLHRGPHVLAIPGTSNAHHLTENIAAAALQLSQDELARLQPLHTSE